jgi:hypothetical protein
MIWSGHVARKEEIETKMGRDDFEEIGVIE